MKKYQPIPVDTSITPIPEYLQDLTEKLAENVHENWAKKRLEEGWRYGPVFSVFLPYSTSYSGHF